MQYPVVRLEILGQDGDRLRRFYSDVLGWPLETGSGRPTAEAGVIAARESTPIPVDEAFSGARTSIFYAKVPDLSAALGRALSYGSEVLVPPTLLEHTVVAVVSDPAGNPVGLCT